MQSKIVLRRSQRDNILWHFFVILDHVEDGAPGRKAFVNEMLARFGVSPSRLEDLTQLVCDRFPENLHDLDANEIMGVFEQALPIEWENDLHQFDAEQSAEFRRSILGILATRKPEQLPREVSRLVINELKRVAGGNVNAEALPRAAAALEELFIRELWRSKDAVSQTSLANRVIYDLKGVAQVEFVLPPVQD